MKKKKKHTIKFKPLQQFYDHLHTHTLFNSKSVRLSKVSPEKLTLHQASVGGSRGRKVKTHKQLPNSEASTIPCCQTSFSEDLPMLNNEATTQSADVGDCQGENNSCISKEDGAVMIGSDHIGGAEHNNMTFSAPSVSSACPDALEKSLNGQTTRIRSLADQISAEDCDKNTTGAHKDSGEAALPTAVLSDGSETPFRDECEGSDHKNSEKPCILANAETGTSDENPSATVLKNSDENESSKSNPPITSTHVMHGNESEELVDVRICDICGDVGREACLALCSKCNDGAEHIYCMTPKMEKVPESDWLCEECTLTRDPKIQRQASMEGSDNVLASKPSCSKEPSKDLPAKSSAVQHVDNMRNNLLSEASDLSDKRLGSAIEARSKIKKRSVARSGRPPKAGSGVKTRLTRVSSLVNMDKGKDAARQVSSFVDLPAKKVVKQTCSSGDRSPKPEQQFCGGNGNPVKSSDSNIEVRRPQNMYRRSSAKENAFGELKKGLSDKKACKSQPQTGGRSISKDLNAHSSVSTTKSLRYKSGKNNSETRDSVANKTNQLDTPVAGSNPMKVSSPKTNVVSKVFKVSNSSKRNVTDDKAIQVNGTTHGKALGSPVNDGENCMNTSEENGNADHDQRLNTENTEVANQAKDKNDHSVVSCDSKHLKAMPKLDAEDIDYLVPSATSAVPESSCIWKGTFKLEKSGELPIDCYGVQAHLSTGASSKVVELVHKFSPEMLLKKVPRSHAWPIQFQKNQPTEQDIALYFFAQDLWSYGRSYRMLLESVTDHDLALEANFGDFQLLVFPSSLLPARSQRWNSLPFFWGVFRKRKVDDGALPPSSHIDTTHQGLYPPVTCGSESTFASAPVTGSLTFNNFVQGPESVGPVVLQYSAGDQNFDLELPLPEEHIGMLQKHGVEADAATFTDAWSLHSNDLQKGERFFDEDMESISKTAIIRGDHSARGYPESIGYVSDGIYKYPSVTLAYDSAPELCQRHDVVSGSSFSFDSGPSASSDCGEPSRSCTDLNLDLCLGNRSGSEEAVDLDLVLGLPTRNGYQPKNSVKNRDKDVSLVLSLGMPWSTR